MQLFSAKSGPQSTDFYRARGCAGGHRGEVHTYQNLWRCQEGLENYIVSTRYRNKFRKTRTSLRAVWPWHTLTSKGPGTCSLQDVIKDGVTIVSTPTCCFSSAMKFKIISLSMWHILASAFSLCLHMVEEARDLSGTSFTEAPVPFLRVPPS